MAESKIDEESTAGCRAKFYHFSKGHWGDKGMGHVECLVPAFGIPTIVMYAESTQSDDSTSISRRVLLVSKITIEGSYDLEGGREMSIILWREKDEGTGDDVAYALSFQDSEKCWIAWKTMMSIKPGYHLKDGKLMRTTNSQETCVKVKQYMAFSEHVQEPFLPWQVDMTEWQSDLWKDRIYRMGKERMRLMGPPSMRPRDLIFCSNVDAFPSLIEPLFEEWFISQVLSFLDLPSIVTMDTALSSFLLRKRWLDAMPLVKCPLSVDNFDFHERDSVQWMISRRLKMSRLSIVPWYMFTHGGADDLYSGDATCIFKDFNLIGDRLQTLEIITTGRIEGEGFDEWGAFYFDNSSFSDRCLAPLSTCKALQSLRLEFSEERSWLRDNDYLPLLSELQQLKKLRLKHARVSDAVLQVLARDSRQLEDVEIVMSMYPSVSFNALVELVTQLPLLRRLVLDFLNSPDGSNKTMLASLAQCPLLEELYLSRIHDEVTNEDVRELIQRCNKLTKLGFYYASALKDSHFAIIGSSTSITSLALKECEGCTNNALLSLARDGRLQLKELTIEFWEYVDEWFDDEGNPPEMITDAGVMTLATRFATSLESLTLKYCSNVTDDGLAVLAICPHLRSIGVDDCELITGAFLEPLSESCRCLEKIALNLHDLRRGSNLNFRAIADRCPLLRDVTLSSATDEKVVRLVRGCPLLTHVRLYGESVSDMSLAAMATGLPHLELLSMVHPHGWGSNIANGTTQAGMRILVENCPRIAFLKTGVRDITDPTLLQMILQRRVLVAGFFNKQY